MLPNIQFIPLFVQLWIIPMHPIAGSWQEGISIFLRDLLGAMKSSQALCSPKQTNPESSATPQRTGLPALSPVWLYSSALVCFLLHTHRKAMKMLNRVGQSLLLTGCAVWDAPKGEICPLGCQGTCWLILSLLPTRTLRSCSAWLLCSQFSPKEN